MSLQQIADELLEFTGASRVTIRFPPEYPVEVEACAPGISSIQGTLADQGSKTFTIIKNEKRIVVQDDVFNSPPIYPELVDIYGLRAQIFAPIVQNEELNGLIAVHNVEPRAWSEEDVAAVVQAVEHVIVERQSSSPPP